MKCKCGLELLGHTICQECGTDSREEKAVVMSNEYKDWMWENRQDALRAIALLEESNEILSELSGFEHTDLATKIICVAIHALREDLE